MIAQAGDAQGLRRSRCSSGRWPPPNPNAAANARGPQEHDGPARHQGSATGAEQNEAAPNHANYDEAIANPYPKLPIR